MVVIIDGKKVAKEIKDRIRQEVEELKADSIIPSLHTILVGDDPASESYVKMKIKACREVGMEADVHEFSSDISQKSLEDTIYELNEAPDIHGILVQLPLPKHIEKSKIIDLIDYKKDVDGFTRYNRTRLEDGEDCLEPCTPKGILKLLDYYNIPVESRHVVIIGRSSIVGKPLYHMMRNRNATVTQCHSRTKPLKYYTAQADILVAAIGKPLYITEDMAKEGSVIIDVGSNKVADENGYKWVGDVDFENVKNKAGYITPVPGGVGPMTIACVVENTLKACRMQNGL